MAEKRYYWLKLKETFFEEMYIKALRRQPQGDSLVIAYLKMQLRTLKTNGVFTYGGFLPDSAAELALAIDEPEEIVKTTLEALIKFGVVERASNKDLLMIEMQKCIGSESSSTQRVKKMRAKSNEAALQCNEKTPQFEDTALQCNEKTLQFEDTALQCNATINKEIRDKEIRDKKKRNNKKESEKIKNNYADDVTLTQAEYNKLMSEHSRPFVDKCIEILNNYKLSKGAKYKSDYHAIRSWVIGEVQKRYPQLASQPSEQQDPEDLFKNPWTDICE